MKNKKIKTIGIHEAYMKDPIKADLDIFDREVEPTSRRGFLKKKFFIWQWQLLLAQTYHLHKICQVV